MWKYRGKEKPDFAVAPDPGQESVWDYPRPPKLMPDTRQVEVFTADQRIASSQSCYRVLETASPPTFYIPPADIDWQHLRAAAGSSVCEWKGVASYWGLSASPQLGAVGWSYPQPTPAFEEIKDYVSFYPAVLACFVAGERVRPQPGRFYGGWVTREIVGPFKGEPGTGHW
jgi:uncharacterized protein (DUF427 family)